MWKPTGSISTWWIDHQREWSSEVVHISHILIVLSKVSEIRSHNYNHIYIYIIKKNRLTDACLLKLIHQKIPKKYQKKKIGIPKKCEVKGGAKKSLTKLAGPTSLLLIKIPKIQQLNIYQELEKKSFFCFGCLGS